MQIPAVTLHRFWTMLAHYHAQAWNAAERAQAFSVSSSTVRRYLDILTGALVVRQLPPWHENISKRQVRSPKVYLADTGLLHVLLGVHSPEDLVRHPKVGASWEGFALREVLNRLEVDEEACYFWATHAGAELDLLVVRGSQRLGLEFKRTTRPSTTHSMRTAIATFALDRLDVIHAGEHSFPLADGIRAVALERIFDDLQPL